MAELTSGGFREVLADTIAIDPEQVTRLVFCSGKIYYDLLAAREAHKANHVALVRIEQLYPFAESDANDALLRYPLTAEGSVGAGGAAQHGGLAVHRGTAAAAASAERAGVAICGASGKRQPGDRVGTAAPGGAGGYHGQGYVGAAGDGVAAGQASFAAVNNRNRSYRQMAGSRPRTRIISRLP
ncbi:MAG TPA: hypothetical protein VMR62_28990 [Bryobacteraceae bacterium]|nr:hypothetical protein [Bryobacteraceae bacterium]